MIYAYIQAFYFYRLYARISRLVALCYDNCKSCLPFQEYAGSLGMPYIETSAKQNTNITQPFETIAAQLVEGSDSRSIVQNDGVPRGEDRGTMLSWKNCLIM